MNEYKDVRIFLSDGSVRDFRIYEILDAQFLYDRSCPYIEGYELREQSSGEYKLVSGHLWTIFVSHIIMMKDLD